MRVVLKKGKERAIALKHHWIFSGALHSEDAEDGAIIPVCSISGEVLGYGYYNSASQIRVRMLSFGDTPFTDDALFSLIKSSFERRKDNALIKETDAVRMIFSEGDFLPGLVADSYNGHLVLQFLTLGMDRRRDTITGMLKEIAAPQSIYERSDYPGRSLEGLGNVSGQIDGTTPDEVMISELGIQYPVDIKKGQKTGFFIDQRENRALIKEISKGKSILNVFSYTGGFTMAALQGGAASAISVDISAKANKEAESIYSMNGFTQPSQYITADAFDYLRNERCDADIVIIDPPAFVKTRNDVDKACRGYKDINLNLFKKAHPSAYVLTCSCSRFIDMDLFQKVIFGAVCDSGRKAQIIRKTGHPADHPVNIAVPETEYLKAILLKLC